MLKPLLCLSDTGQESENGSQMVDKYFVQCLDQHTGVTSLGVAGIPNKKLNI